MTATNSDGTTQATSPASTILANPPVNTVAPSLSGTAQDGVTVTAASGTWTGMATITYTYQWQQSSDGGATWNDIAGATATTYTPPAGSAGKQLRAQVTATNSDGTTQSSSPTSTILANPPVNTVTPSLSGTAQDGVTLTAASGTWTGMATITYTYQWQQSSDGGATWNDIAGATATTYTPPAGSAGKQLRAQVTATNTDGTTQSSSPTSTILANPPVNTVTPSLSGTAQDGVTLTAASGTWTGMATITYTYQWQQSSDGGATWNDIAGATATTYTPAGSAGKQLHVVVTATNGDGTAQATSPASAIILPGPTAPSAASPSWGTSPAAATQPLPPQTPALVSVSSTPSTGPKAKPSKSKSKLGIAPAPWSKPLSFQSAAGWRVGASGTVRRARSAGKALSLRYPESTAWTSNVRYRDPATADPSQPTIYKLAKNGVLVTAVIQPPSGTTQPLSLDLRNARPFLCCGGTPRSFELVGLTRSHRYEAIIHVYFGATPNARLWAIAQQAVRRIELPRGR